MQMDTVYYGALSIHRGTKQAIGKNLEEREIHKSQVKDYTDDDTA